MDLLVRCLEKGNIYYPKWWWKIFLCIPWWQSAKNHLFYKSKYVFSCSPPHIFPIKQKTRETGMTPRSICFFFFFRISPLQLANLFVWPKTSTWTTKNTLPTFNMVHLKMAPWNRRFWTLETIIFRFQPLNLGECMFCCSLRFFQTKKPTKSQVLGFKHTAFSKKAVSAGPINFWPKSNCAKTLGSNTSNCHCGSRHKMGELSFWGLMISMHLDQGICHF